MDSFTVNAIHNNYLNALPQQKKKINNSIKEKLYFFLENCKRQQLQKEKRFGQKFKDAQNDNRCLFVCFVIKIKYTCKI